MMTDPTQEKRRIQKKVLREARAEVKRETRKQRRNRILEINRALQGKHSQETLEGERLAF